MFSHLNAEKFKGSLPFYQKAFESILSKIVDCYQLMLNDQVTLVNDENKIRDILLLDYLKNDTIRKKIGLLRWHFEREIQEDRTIGRTDIKIISQDTFKTQNAYYIIECKRLNNKNTSGKTGLNGEYIKNGIHRFTSNYYSSFYYVNGMVGFVVEKMDIDQNVDKINNLLFKDFAQVVTIKKITRENFIDNFNFHYSSMHKDIEQDELKIYHLMLDCSSLLDH